MGIDIKVIIDRFEEGFAVCERENRTMINIKKELLPQGSMEGQVIILKEDGIIIDFQETEKRRKEIEEKTKDFWK